MADTKLTDFAEAVIGDFPGDLYGVFGGADKKVPTELFAAWRTIYNATPTAVSQIVIDVTNYNIIRWSATNIRHDDAVTNRSINITFSADNGASYTLTTGALTTYSSTTDVLGSGLIFKATHGYLALGTHRPVAIPSQYNSIGGVIGTPQPTTFAFKPTGGASFQAVGNIKVEVLI